MSLNLTVIINPKCSVVVYVYKTLQGIVKVIEPQGYMSFVMPPTLKK